MLLPGEETDDIVLDHRLQRIDRGHIDRRLSRPPRPQRLGGIGLGLPRLGELVGRLRLDLEQIRNRASGSQIAAIAGGNSGGPSTVRPS